MPHDPSRLLAELDGAVPAAPDWYRAAMATPCETRRVDVAGAAIEVLCWGAPERPGLLLLHGSSAHARWWGPLAPMLAEQYRVVSLSFSGMGGSDWRQHYSISGMVDEALAAAATGGVLQSGRRPFVVAHSFGGNPAMMMAERHGGRLAGTIVVDSLLLSAAPPLAQLINYQLRFYRSEREALSRFRFAPPQRCDNLFIVDDIARASLRHDPTLGEKPWTWRFDPSFYPNLDWDWNCAVIGDAGCPLGFIRGRDSTVVTAASVDRQRAQLPPGTPFVSIDAAGHHVMADQPIALLATIRAFLETWR